MWTARTAFLGVCRRSIPLRWQQNNFREASCVAYADIEVRDQKPYPINPFGADTQLSLWPHQFNFHSIRLPKQICTEPRTSNGGNVEYPSNIARADGICLIVGERAQNRLRDVQPGWQPIGEFDNRPITAPNHA